MSQDVADKLLTLLTFSFLALIKQENIRKPNGTKTLNFLTRKQIIFTDVFKRDLEAFCFSPWSHFKFAHWNSVLCRPQRPGNSLADKKDENASKCFASFQRISKILKFFWRISLRCIMYYEYLMNREKNVHWEWSITKLFVSFDFWLQY